MYYCLWQLFLTNLKHEIRRAAKALRLSKSIHTYFSEDIEIKTKQEDFLSNKQIKIRLINVARWSLWRQWDQETSSRKWCGRSGRGYSNGHFRNNSCRYCGWRWLKKQGREAVSKITRGPESSSGFFWPFLHHGMGLQTRIITQCLQVPVIF